MGGPSGVRESEQYTLVIGLKNGMSMHAVPRPGVVDSLCNGAGEALKPAAVDCATEPRLPEALQGDATSAQQLGPCLCIQAKLQGQASSCLSYT